MLHLDESVDRVWEIGRRMDDEDEHYHLEWEDYTSEQKDRVTSPQSGGYPSDNHRRCFCRWTDHLQEDAFGCALVTISQMWQRTQGYPTGCP